MQTPSEQPGGIRLGWHHAWLAMSALVLTIVVFEMTNLDLALQDRCYDETAGRWWVDAGEPVGRAIFYDGPKAAVWIVGLTALALAVGPQDWRARWGLERRGLWLALLTVAMVPALAGLGKKVTNTFCPSELRRYGGDIAYVKLCEPYSAQDRPARRGHCFPAGHASGGFALIGLLAVRRTRRWRWTCIALGLVAGWAMGGYQMLKGAHYLSHTVITMLLAYLTAAVGHAALFRGAVLATESLPPAVAVRSS